MQFDTIPQKQKSIEEALSQRFRQAAVSPDGLFAYPTGREGLRALAYPPDFIDSLLDEAAQCYCGVGNPFAPGLPEPGERVLDVGCGAGVDAIAAARFVGPQGCVAGLELSPHMLARAEANLHLSGAANVMLEQGGAESLPFADASFDLLISNGVYNLVPNKPRALAEAFRVLAPGGRLQVADQIRESEQPQSCPLPQPGESPGELWAK
ncbi:MAG TPA: methyltransferase domain-containing protein [Humidesulfovibrio sp.]|nr:methyltransferase domain-containing protein [Humidesulfovibrio sp.]HWR02539.1 methyltransferase domain-containing protein [Humidesulfovibrio sp.]